LNNIKLSSIIDLPISYFGYFMEELQSTEILDREILEDARKKVVRILKTAEETVHAQTAEWENKTLTSIDELDKKYGEQQETVSAKIMARLPVDKHRVKIEKIEGLLYSAVETWFKNLNRRRILDLLTEELAKRLALCEDFSSSGKISALINGIDRKEAESVFKKLNLTCDINEDLTVRRYPSIMLEIGKVRVIASIEKIVDFLLQEKRAELVAALIDPAFIEEEA
jgi:vacuolar-type H+-ATPase subunit E/Vma4